MIFFLDFDGVLHPFFPLSDRSDEENQHFSYLPNFEAAVRECGEFEIVISSSWRKNHSLEEIKALFSPDVAERIVGATPQIGTGNEPGERQAEIEAWLEANNRQGHPWIGLDDYADIFRPGAVLVVCHDGFRAREAALLAEAVADPKAFAERHRVPGRYQDTIKPTLNTGKIGSRG